jgi:hypothetical protein
LLPVDRTWVNDPVLESATFTILLFCDGAEAGCETASHVAQQPCEHFFAEMDGSLFEPTTEMSSQEAFLVTTSTLGSFRLHHFISWGE